MNELVNGVKYAVGVDLGGSFVKSALVSELGDILYSDKLPLGKNANREVILSILHTSIHSTLKKAREMGKPVSGIGIGTPGIVNKGVVLGGADNLSGWKNIFLSSIFSKAFKLPVLVDNDANVMGLGEVAYGAARGDSDVVFITVGNGIGGAVVINGKLFGGHGNRGTELGHITIDYDGIDCSCGGRGCLEAYASTLALIQQYALKTGKKESEIDGYNIVEEYLEGEEAAVECMNDHTRYLGHGIASLINIFAPQKVVVGGGISEAGSFYINLIRKATFKYAMPDCAANTEVVAAMLGNQAGSLGAASLVFNGLKFKL
jgi:glucokinase